jgi:SAM-dependent methyltransferase
MSDPVRDLYSKLPYPALTHPAAHPGVIAATARLSGLRAAATPGDCRGLDLGCASGHHLLALAARFPESRWVGVDFCADAIRRAREAAAAAGLGNLRFEVADLREWDPGDERFDYVIAHGMLSWVDDAAKARLLDLCAAALTDRGVACLSYSTLPAGALRREAAGHVRALPMLADDPADLDARLEALAEVAALNPSPYGRHLTAIFEDFRRKGAEILPFDELAPICDPLYLAEVARWTADRGLRYFGESLPADNLPPEIDPAAMAKLAPLESDPLRFQQALDLFSGRTHRTSLFCRAGALDAEPPSAADTLTLHARLRIHPLPEKAVHGEIVGSLHAALAAAAPTTRPVADLIESCARRLGSAWQSGPATATIADWLYQAARLGWVELRADAIDFPAHPPRRPNLGALNLHFVRTGAALVDGFHRSFRLPESHAAIAARFDGRRSADELERLAADETPDLDFRPWLAHLAARGVFPAA